MIKCTLHLDEQSNDQTKDCGMDEIYFKPPKITSSKEMTQKPKVFFG